MSSFRSRPGMILTFTEVLDRTFRIYRENFLPMAGFTALITVPVSVIQLLISLSTSRTLLSSTSGSFQSRQLQQQLGTVYSVLLLVAIASLVEIVVVGQMF